MEQLEYLLQAVAAELVNVGATELHMKRDRGWQVTVRMAPRADEEITLSIVRSR